MMVRILKIEEIKFQWLKYEILNLKGNFDVTWLLKKVQYMRYKTPQILSSVLNKFSFKFTSESMLNSSSGKMMIDVFIAFPVIFFVCANPLKLKGNIPLDLMVKPEALFKSLSVWTDQMQDQSYKMKLWLTDQSYKMKYLLFQHSSTSRTFFQDPSHSLEQPNI